MAWWKVEHCRCCCSFEYVVGRGDLLGDVAEFTQCGGSLNTGYDRLVCGVLL